MNKDNGRIANIFIDPQVASTARAMAAFNNISLAQLVENALREHLKVDEFSDVIQAIKDKKFRPLGS